MSLLSVSNLSVKLRDTPVFHGVTFDIQEGEFVGLIGPTGAGKTTLMRAALGLLPFAGKSSMIAQRWRTPSPKWTFWRCGTGLQRSFQEGSRRAS